MKAFSLSDPRNIFPKCGVIVDRAMKAKGFTNTALAKRLGIDHTAVAGYRRGHKRPAAARVKEVETLLGVKLDMSEATPSKARKAASAPQLPLTGAPVVKTVRELIDEAHEHLAQAMDLLALARDAA